MLIEFATLAIIGGIKIDIRKIRRNGNKHLASNNFAFMNTLSKPLLPSPKKLNVCIL